jgi:hypothetical protein
MKSFDHFNRRTHLYLGLFLTPWLVMYGFSSFLISHHAWFRSDQQPAWQPVFDREYQRAVPEGAELRSVAQGILADCGLEGAFWAQRPKPDEIRINRFRFWDETRLTYALKDHRLRAEKQKLRWDQVVLRMHFRGGFMQPTLRDTLWAVLVDLACVGILVWVASGLIMWWRLARLRFWGALAVLGGTVSFVLLISRL